MTRGVKKKRSKASVEQWEGKVKRRRVCRLFLLCALLHEWRQGLEVERNLFQLHLINTIKIQLLLRTAATAWKDFRLRHHLHVAKADIFQCALACSLHVNRSDVSGFMVKCSFRLPHLQDVKAAKAKRAQYNTA